MSKLATVTTLRPRRDDAEPERADGIESSRTDYWERIQALRAELDILRASEVS